LPLSRLHLRLCAMRSRRATTRGWRPAAGAPCWRAPEWPQGWMRIRDCPWQFWFRHCGRVTSLGSLPGVPASLTLFSCRLFILVSHFQIGFVSGSAQAPLRCRLADSIAHVRIATLCVARAAQQRCRDCLKASAGMRVQQPQRPRFVDPLRPVKFLESPCLRGCHTPVLGCAQLCCGRREALAWECTRAQRDDARPPHRCLCGGRCNNTAAPCLAIGGFANQRQSTSSRSCVGHWENQRRGSWQGCFTHGFGWW
jgi:hypothetical protein